MRTERITSQSTGPGLALLALAGDRGVHGAAASSARGDRHGTLAVSVSGNWRVTFHFVGKDADTLDYEDYQ